MTQDNGATVDTKSDMWLMEELFQIINLEYHKVEFSNSWEIQYHNRLVNAVFKKDGKFDFMYLETNDV